eukprot:361029_1
MFSQFMKPFLQRARQKRALNNVSQNIKWYIASKIYFSTSQNVEKETLLADLSLPKSYSKYFDRSTYSSTLQPIEFACGLGPEVYADNGWNLLEREKVFKRAWVAVDMLAGRLQEPGDCLATSIAGIPIIITNDSGNLRGFYNICRHRSSTLLNEGFYSKCNTIRCPYHSWVYSCGGDLVRAPFFNDDKMPSNQTQKDDPSKQSEIFKFEKVKFDKKDYGLIPIGVKVFMGAIFVNLDKNIERREKLFEYQFGDLLKHYGHYPYGDCRIVHQQSFDIDCNWKLIMENANDYYHSFTIHPRLLDYSSTANHIRRQGIGQYNGIATYPVTYGNSPTDIDKFEHFAGITNADKVAAWFIHIFPNIDYFLMPHHILTLITQPDPNKAAHCSEKLTIMFDKDIQQKFLHGDDMKTHKKIEELLAFWDLVNTQDIDACEKVQKGIESARDVVCGGKISAKFEQTFYRFQHILIDYMTDQHMKEYPGDDDFVTTDKLPQYDIYGNASHCSESSRKMKFFGDE